MRSFISKEQTFRILQKIQKDWISAYVTNGLLTHSLVGCVSICLCILSLNTGCTQKIGDVKTTEIDSLEFTSLTTDVSTLISEGGITKYKLETDVWYTYNLPENKWYFPKGLYLEQFDTLFNIEASIKADTAYFYPQRDRWELYGNVEVLNQEGQQFFSNSLFWDQTKEEIYTHDHIRIIKSEGQIIEAKYGFRSNQDMTRYELFNSFGHMDIDEENTSSSAAKTSNDTVPTTLPSNTKDSILL